MDNISEQMESRWIKDVSSLGIEAVCNDIYDIWSGEVYDCLKEGQTYKVARILMTTDFTKVFFDGYEGSFNSVNFDFFIDGKEHDIYEDERCWSEALIQRHQRLQELSSTIANDFNPQSDKSINTK